MILFLCFAVLGASSTKWQEKKLHVIILIQSDVLAPVHDSGSFLTVSQTQNLSRIETWGSCKGHMLEIFLSEPNPSWNIEVPMFFFFFFGRCSSNKTSIKPIKKTTYPVIFGGCVIPRVPSEKLHQ